MKTAEMRESDAKRILARHEKNKKSILAQEQIRNAGQDCETCGGYDGQSPEVFKQGYDAAKEYYYSQSQIRLSGLLDSRADVERKSMWLSEAERKIRDLINECEFYSKCMREVESHYLTRCVRFLQSFHSRCWWKLSDISSSGRYFIKAFFPRKKGYEPEHRSALYQTLQAHLAEKQIGKGEDL